MSFSKPIQWYHALMLIQSGRTEPLKVHKNEKFFGFDFEFCTISLLVLSKY